MTLVGCSRGTQNEHLYQQFQEDKASKVLHRQQYASFVSIAQSIGSLNEVNKTSFIRTRGMHTFFLHLLISSPALL